MESDYFQMPIETIELKPTAWLNWCRLCGKEDTDDNANNSYLDEKSINELKNIVSNTILTEALEKFFQLKVTSEDLMPNSLCTDCLCIVSNGIAFSEHVLRVQNIYSYVLHDPNASDNKALRLKFMDLDVARNQIFANYRDGIVAFNHITAKVKNENKLAQRKHETPEPKEMASEEEFIPEKRKKNKIEKVFKNNDDYDDEDDKDRSNKIDPFKESQNNTKNKPLDSDQEDDICDDIDDDDFASFDEMPLDINVHTSFSASDSDEEEIEKPKRKRKKVLKEEQGTSASAEEDGDDVQEKTEQKRKKVYKKHKSKSVPQQKKEIQLETLEITCKECDFAMTSYEMYKEHTQQKHAQLIAENIFKCLQCEKKLVSKYCFEKHLKIIHVPKDLRYCHKCEHCEQRFISPAQLERHFISKHEDRRRFICEECGHRVKTIATLKEHMLTHVHEKPYECEECQMRFKTKVMLKYHIKDKHSGIEHKCTVCGLVLKSRKTLRQHMSVHSDAMPYKCDHCGRDFKRVKTYKQHLIIHTGLKPYSCEFCDTTFANGSSRRAHMKRNHPRELEAYDAAGFKTQTNIPSIEHLKEASKAVKHMNFMPKHSPPVRKNAIIISDVNVIK